MLDVLSTSLERYKINTKKSKNDGYRHKRERCENKHKNDNTEL